MEKNKMEKIRGKCSFCKEEAVALVRGKKLCRQHWIKFKKGELFIPLKFN
jgi:hypothetical protein